MIIRVENRNFSHPFLKLNGSELGTNNDIKQDSQTSMQYRKHLGSLLTKHNSITVHMENAKVKNHRSKSCVCMTA